jgi:hypothetical protein
MAGRILLGCLLSGLFAGVSMAQTQPAPDNSPAQSWKETSTQQNPSGNLNPTRTRESHSESNGRIIDKQSVERLGPDGRYEPYLDVEKESVKVDATTTRTVERTYDRNSEGTRMLRQQVAVETRSLGTGEQKMVRSTSNPDANGNLQLVRREVSEAKQVNPNVTETKTTVFSPDLNGGLAPVAQIQERETKTGEHSAKLKKSTLLPDGNGGWQVSEVQESVRQGVGTPEQIQDDRVSRPDGNGNLAVSERTVTKQDQTAPGESQNTVEKYEPNVPGTSPDGSLRLTRRYTTVQKRSAGGSKTIQQSQQLNPANPSDGMQVTGKTIDIVRPGSDGSSRQTTTVLSPDSKGDLGVVWVDTAKKDSQPAVKVDTKKAPPR